VLNSLLGYGLAVLAVTVDLGRPWELWKVQVFFWRWTGSPQLDVALCVAFPKGLLPSLKGGNPRDQLRGNPVLVGLIARIKAARKLCEPEDFGALLC
jgi:hypothetical protein